MIVEKYRRGVSTSRVIEYVRIITGHRVVVFVDVLEKRMIERKMKCHGKKNRDTGRERVKIEICREREREAERERDRHRERGIERKRQA